MSLPCYLVSKFCVYFFFLFLSFCWSFQVLFFNTLERLIFTSRNNSVRKSKSLPAKLFPIFIFSPFSRAFHCSDWFSKHTLLMCLLSALFRWRNGTCTVSLMIDLILFEEVKITLTGNKIQFFSRNSLQQFFFFCCCF